MPSNRFYLSYDFSPNQSLDLLGDEFHHMTRVMRCSEGEKVDLVNGKNFLAKATIETISKKKASLQIHSIEKRPLSTPLILANGIPKLHKLEWILEKGTELGVTEFWLFPSAHSEIRILSENRLKRLRAITISAMKQCGRLDLPQIHFYSSLSCIHKQDFPCFFGDVRKSAKALKEPLGKNKKCIFIGPEQGFTEEEVHYLETTVNAEGITLHPNILRTETAAIVAAQTLQFLSY
ncbi:MAG: 16S rRNA (uracil(1498)-N(3))-methyltransferase [Simkaniaceae bacterium]|nr:16S rRNA (uracil(1498)-N(3))-methyltransferase [Simkaniaceae bacterium]